MGHIEFETNLPNNIMFSLIYDYFHQHSLSIE